jgi:hypothetical protein
METCTLTDAAKSGLAVIQHNTNALKSLRDMLQFEHEIVTCHTQIIAGTRTIATSVTPLIGKGEVK